MKIDVKTSKRVARLARIEVLDEQLVDISKELTNIVEFMEQLNEVDISDLKKTIIKSSSQQVDREDKVTDGDYQTEILNNAPDSQAGFFAVTKVIE